MSASKLVAALLLVGCGAKSELPQGEASSSSAGSGGAASSSGVASSASSSSSGAGGSCGTCECELTCCGARCANLQNDIQNCGHCGNVCPGEHPYCDGGVCGTPPCTGTTCGEGSLCCGSMCCNAGELCCTTHAACCDFTQCQAPSADGTCDVGNPCSQCAAPDTPIATPSGERPIDSLHVGDLVYTVQEEAIAVVPIREVRRVRVQNHRVLRVELAGGLVLRLSPGHPTADGRTMADLAAGGSLGGVAIERVTAVPYDEPYTFDILPDSETGTYFAGSALIGSTLFGSAERGVR